MHYIKKAEKCHSGTEVDQVYSPTFEITRRNGIGCTSIPIFCEKSQSLNVYVMTYNCLIIIW